MCQSQLRHVVLEGAPGQGKSTIVQYVCQIHRHHLLNEALDDQRIPEAHRINPVRIPFKVDCRDLDVWLRCDQPFPIIGDPPVGRHRSLESFLCAHLQHHSGGSSFDVDDLHALVRFCSILLVFDGLDEVADIDGRATVVEHITKGNARLEEAALSVQTIVTSRPAAFSNSPSFPRNRFLYVHLTSIDMPIIREYTDRWLHARQLEDREASEVKGILESKLDQPHMAELSRNPMQLAILLSLIHTRGVSLPDKRTALYDSYVDLFFAREAEKNLVVRDYRDLLIDIHRFLAWTLHSEAQIGGTQGSVRASRLRDLVTTYLASEGHDASLVDRLFSGITERVVSRIVTWVLTGEDVWRLFDWGSGELGEIGRALSPTLFSSTLTWPSRGETLGDIWKYQFPGSAGRTKRPGTEIPATGLGARCRRHGRVTQQLAEEVLDGSMED